MRNVGVWVTVVAMVSTISFKVHAAPPYSSEDGQFTATFPDTPAVGKQDLESPVGKLVLHTFTLERDGAVFAVMYTDYPQTMVKLSNADTMLDGAVSGMISSTKAALIETKKITQSDAPGRDVTFSITAGPNKQAGRARILLSGVRMYQVLVLEPAAASPSPTANDFFKTFTFKPRAAVASITKSQGPLPIKSFVSVAGQFRVSIPGTPNEAQQDVPTPAGNVVAHLFSIEDQGVTYMVMYADYPEGLANGSNADAMLDGAVNGMVTNIKATPLETKKISQAGVPGRDATFSVTTGGIKRVGHGLVFLAGNRLYQALVLEPEPGGKSEAARTFLRSFTIKTTEAAPESPSAVGPAPLKSFSSDAGRFSVTMPGTPKENDAQFATAVGKLDAHQFATEDQGVTYTVTYVDYPKNRIARATPSDVLDDAVDKLVANMKGSLVASKKFMQAGTPGRELSWSSTEGTDKIKGRAKLYLVSNRLYQSYLFGPESLVQSPAADKYLESFKFQSATKGAPKAKAAGKR